MAIESSFENSVREMRFTRLVDCYHAAARWGLWNTMRWYENKLHLLGAWRDVDGCWRIDYANQPSSSHYPSRRA